MSWSSVIASLAFFVLAGICEVGGGYLVWAWIRGNAGVATGLAGGGILFLYGIVATFQPSNFTRTYAAYGGIFILLSILWGWWIGGQRPDRADLVGAAVCMAGAGIILYWPRE